MKFHVIRKLTFFREQTAIDWFHADMFHGGELAPFRNADPRQISPSRPLRLWKNVYEMPDLFEPTGACALVVSQRLMENLADLPNLAFLPVEFSRAFGHPYRAHDFSHRKKWLDWRDRERFIREQKHDPDAAISAGPFFELLIPRLADVAPRFEALRRYDIRIGPTKFDEPIVAHLSPHVLAEFPITWNSGFFFSVAAFERASASVNWDYFLRWDSR